MPARRAITREQVEGAEALDALADDLIDLIENNPRVRAAILRLARPRQARPTVSTRKTGGR